MSPKFLRRAAVAAAMLATGLAAQAGTMTYNGAYHGGFNNVAVSTPLPYTGGPAGGFSVTLSGYSEFGGELNGPFEAYCIDVAEYIGTSSSYGLMAAVDYFSNASKVEQLGKLISYAYGTNIFGGEGVDKDAQSTALQLAIWNIVYDTDSTTGNALTSGPFQGSITSATGTHLSAQVLLNSSASASAGAYDLYVLASGQPLNLAGNKQDQLIWKESPSRRDLPEPASLALVGLALGGAALASRRRRA